MLESGSEPQGVAPKHIAVLAVIVVLAATAGGYAIHEHNAAQNLAASNQSLAASNARSAAALNATEQQVSDLAAKVNTLAAREETPAPSAVRAAGASRRVAVRRDDPRFKKLQAQLDAQGKEIDQTQSDLANTQGDLSNTRTELTGSIAHTHDELVLLEKKGERNYAEFDLTKSKEFKREGPMELRLKKADSKHQYADLELMVDDRNLSQKHVNLYQPVTFYTPDSPQPIEAVINSIGKDHIHGYVSSPKYNQSDLASMANASATENPANAAGTGNPAQSASQPQDSSGNPQPASSNSQASSTRQRLPMSQ